MTLIDDAGYGAQARIDADGRLVEADPAFLELNARAGGAIGAPVAIPQVAGVARLARRLGIAISRRVIAADGDHDRDLWVRAVPEDGAVRLRVGGIDAPADDMDLVDVLPGEAETAAESWRWETDAGLRITYLDPRAGDLYALDPLTLLAQPLTQLFALEADDSGGFPILVAVARQQGFVDQAATIRSTSVRVALSARPLRDAAGRFQGFAGAAAALSAAAEPDAATRDSGTVLPEGFGDRLARALRSPLGKIIANADSISAQVDGPLRSDYAGYANDISSAGRHLLGLVEDLVDLEAVERPDFRIEGEPIDLADVARRASGLLAVRATERSVKIDRPDFDQSLPVTGDFRRALQIMVNLIGNAVRYSPPNGAIWIRLEREGDFGCVIVADQGKGIALADQERIFEKFGRVDPNEPGGSGLGLYIARRLARAMGGDLQVDSAPGQGARFILTLPYREA